MANLTTEFPLAARLIERLTAIDPEYGSQQHQRAFIERAHEMQRRAPCAQKHEHGSGCYAEATVRDVVAWQAAKGGGV